MSVTGLNMINSIYDANCKTIDNRSLAFSGYRGLVLLIVNTASKCGFTPQYLGLEKLYGVYREKGLEVLGFPCNQFGGQEPKAEAEVAEFCSMNYGVTFPLFGKVDVNGEHAAPLFKYLKREAPGVMGTEAIKWNFTKFLISRNGDVVARFGSMTKPETIEASIEVELKKYQ